MVAHEKVSVSPVDAAWLRMDSPDNPMVITTVMRFDAPLTEDGVASALARLVEHRRFRSVDLDQRIIDAKARKRGHRMFDCRQRPSAADAQRRAQFGGADLRPQRRRNGRGFGRQIAAIEADPGAGFGRVDGETRRLAGMDADAVERDSFAQACLISCMRAGDRDARGNSRRLRMAQNRGALARRLLRTDHSASIAPRGRTHA